MSKTTAHRVKNGECIVSIASRHGLPWRAVWDGPANAELRSLRDHPTVLARGDVVHVPARSLGRATGGTGQRHRFRRSAVPATLRLRLMRNEIVLAGEPWRLELPGRRVEGTTDDTGLLECPVPPDATEATLIVDGPEWVLELRLGGLSPVTEVDGVQARLHNLGFDPGDADGYLGPATVAALRDFQELRGLEVTGMPDDATRHALRDAHGC